MINTKKKNINKSLITNNFKFAISNFHCINAINKLNFPKLIKLKDILILDISNSNIYEINSLPPFLQKLNCSNNFLEKLPKLPPFIKRIKYW